MSTSIIKDRKLEIVHSQYELISKVTLLQLAILRKLFAGPFDEELFEEADTNEHVIDRLEIRIREEVAYTIYMLPPRRRTSGASSPTPTSPPIWSASAIW